MILKEGIELNIVTAKWVSDYQLELTFSNGVCRVVDFADFLMNSDQPEVKKYLDVEVFKGFTINFGNLMWNDYDLCFSIEDLYSGQICDFKQEAQDKVAESGPKYGSASSD